MPADYAFIPGTDEAKPIEDGKYFRSKFRLPSGVKAKGGAAILAFKVYTAGRQLDFQISINGTTVYSANDWGSNSWRVMQELFAQNVLDDGDNTFLVKVTGGQGKVQVRDAVVWFRR